MEKSLEKSQPQEIKKPIFIVGVPRSGTTLLYGIFCRHPKLAWFSHQELKFLIPQPEQEIIKRELMKMKQENKKIPKNEQSLFVFGPPSGRALIEGKIPIEAEFYWRKNIDLYQREISLEKKKEIKTTILKILNSQHKFRFMNKSPQNAVRLYTLKEIFPDAKFINIVRDPREVIASMKTRYENEGVFSVDWGFKDMNYSFKKSEKNNDLIDYWAHGYKEILEEIFEFSKKQTPENFISIIYEEFIIKPEHYLEKLLSFCDLEKPEDLKTLMPKNIFDTTQKWKSKLTKIDEENIVKILQEPLKKMNYHFKF